jgi:hypothetical protein
MQQDAKTRVKLQFCVIHKGIKGRQLRPPSSRRLFHKLSLFIWLLMKKTASFHFAELLTCKSYLKDKPALLISGFRTSSIMTFVVKSGCKNRGRNPFKENVDE